MLKKKGIIWVSAVLYIGLGIVVITLILSAGLPLIEKMRDRNIVIQTKDLLFSLDDNIRYATRAPGANKNMLLTIERGSLIISSNEINWSMKVNQKFLEPYQSPDFFTLKEGPLNSRLYETIIKDEYIMNMFLDYTDIACLNVQSEYSSPYSGTFTFDVGHSGVFLEGTKDPDGNNECTELPPILLDPPPPILPNITIEIT